LAYWVHNQRSFWKLYQANKATTITQERIDLLNSIHFEWTGQKPVDTLAEQQDWMQHYEMFKDYRKNDQCTLGEGPPALAQDKCPPKLTKWIKTQQKQYK
jgi:hypothetical protein